MEDIFFSILIPVYNVEKYIEECLNSVIRQTYRNYEVILMNDGSTDCSVQICQEFASHDARFKLYNQSNSGLLITRRNSLKKARGEYILFLDSDDFWDENLLTTVYSSIKSTDCDLLLFRNKRVDDDGNFLKKDIGVFENNTIYDADKKEIVFRELFKSSRINSIWGKVVKKSIVDLEADYSGFKDKKGEDLLQSLPLISNAQKILYLDEPLYNYRISASGRGRNFKPQYFEDFDIVRNEVLKYMKKLGLDSELNKRLFYTYYILSISRYSILMIEKNFSKEVITETITKLKEKEIYQEGKEYLSFKKFNKYELLVFKMLDKSLISQLILYVKTIYLMKNFLKKLSVVNKYKGGR